MNYVKTRHMIDNDITLIPSITESEAENLRRCMVVTIEGDRMIALAVCDTSQKTKRYQVLQTKCVDVTNGLSMLGGMLRSLRYPTVVVESQAMSSFVSTLDLDPHSSAQVRTCVAPEPTNETPELGALAEMWLAINCHQWVVPGCSETEPLLAEVESYTMNDVGPYLRCMWMARSFFQPRSLPTEQYPSTPTLL